MDEPIPAAPEGGDQPAEDAIEAYARRLFAQVDERHGDTWDGTTDERRATLRRLARGTLTPAPSVAAPPRGDREALIPSIEAALFGTTDGGLLDDEDASVPVGEFRRLLREVWARMADDPRQSPR